MITPLRTPWKILCASAAAFGFALLATPATATLTVTPITWNVIGLDSNSPTAGPKDFPVGVRVCSNVATTLVGVVWSFDSANPNINLRPGSLSSITIPSIGVGACADAYFEVEVTQVPAAYDTTRRYHVTATDFSGSASSPTPRELYVEHLISQNRNSTTGVKLDGVSIPAGGSMNLVVGNTYTIELDGATATQGYEQLEEFISFPNTIFQILSVSTTYSADTSLIVPNPNDKLYADACGWDNDPNSPTYRSCVGAAAKAGGTVITTYTVKIVSGGGTSQTLNSLIHDFSGSSYHYNSDFSSGARIATIVDPSLVTLSKKFAPNPTNVGGVSTLTFTLSNPNAGVVSGLNFADVFPTSPGAMVVATPPAAATAGCGTPTFAPVAGAASISFSNGTVAANGSCTVRVNVTVPAAGTYSNTSNHLFVGTVDTGNAATDTLTVNSAPPPPSCVPGVTLANWSVPNGTVANPPDLAGGVPTVKAANVATATASANVPADTNILTISGHVDTTSWRTFGYKTHGQFIDFTVDTSKYTAVQMSFWVANPSPANGPTQITLTVNSGAGFGAPVLTVNAPPIAFTNHTVDLTGLTSTTGNTVFRLSATGANNDASGASLNYDDIVFTGCTVALPPTMTKAFAPNPVAVGATSTLTFTVTNPNGGIALSGVSFTDTLPAGVTAPNSSTPTCGGTLTISSNTLTFAGGTLAAGASCSIPVTVTATTAGPHVNVSGFVSSTQGGTNTGASGIASASLTAVLPPVIAKQFAPNPILPGGVSTLTFTISNPNENDALSSVAFSDTLPTSPGAMVVAGTPAASFSGCGAPTFAPVAGAASVTFSGGTIAGGGTCTVTVNVTAPVVGTYTNTSGNVSHVINAATRNGNTATGSLTVNPTHPAIGVLKQVGLSNNPLGTWASFLATTAGTNVFYKITIENDGDVILTSVGATDPNVNVTGCVWPASLPVAAAGNDNHIAVCVVGPVVAVSGLHTNTVTASGTGGSTVTDTSSASYATTGLTIAKSVAEAFFTAAGNTLHYSYLVTNSGFAPLQGPVTVADSKASVSCPAVTTVGDLDNFLDPGESITCTATYTVTAGDVAAKFVTNVASASVAGVSSPTDSKTVPLLAAPTISKSFTAPNVALNGSVNLSLVLTNPGGATLTGLAFTDNLPLGLTTPNASTAICGGTLTISSNSLSLAGGSLLAGASCTITVSVTGTSAGVKNNTTGPISSNETGSGSTSNTATVTVVAPPTISKAFGAATIPLNGTTSLSLTLTNPNATVALSGISFTDTLPSGLTTPDASTSTCGGTLTVSSNMLSFAGGSLAAGGNCVISVTVTGTSAGLKSNTTGAIGSTEGGTGAISNTATVTVLSPPTISKAFGAATIPLNGTTSLSLTLTNPNATSALSGISFSDTLPAGLTTPDAVTSTCGGTLTVSSNMLSFAGGSLAAGANCVISVTVTGMTAGVKSNTTGAISSTEGGTGTTSNTATVTVVAPPTISKAFGAATIPLNGTTSLTLTVTNPNGTVALSGISFSDTLPAGLTTPDAVTSTCGGTLTVSSNALSFAGGSLAAGGNCVISVTVTGMTAGVKNNTTGAISSTQGGTGTTSNTATVTVVAPPAISKSFGAASIPVNGTTNLNLTITNPNGTVALSGISFSDTLPVGLTTPDAVTPTCGGTLTISSNVLTFAGGTLAAGGNCVISVTVTGTTPGIKNNTTGAITSTEGGTGTTSNTATVTVVGTPTIAKAFGAATIPLSGTTSLSLTVTNPNATTALSGISFSDTLPAGLTTPDAVTSICGGTLTVSSNVLSFAGGSLAAGGNCVISVTVTGVTAGVKNNTTGAISSTQGGTGTTSNTATVTVVAPPAIAKAFGAATIPLNGTTSLSLTVTNPNATTALSGISFTDTLPGGLMTPDAITSTCGGTLTVSSNVLSFAGGSLAGGANCVISVTVTGTTAGVKNNTTTAIGSTQGGTGVASNTATVTVVAPPTIAKSFGAVTIPLNGTTSLSLTITNPNGTVALSGISFMDTLPAGLTTPDAITPTCGGTLTASSNVLSFAGGSLAAGGNCVMTVTVTGTTAGVKNNTTTAIGSTQGGTGIPSNTATVTVVAPPTIAKSFGAARIPLNGTTSLSLTVTNPNATVALSGISFTDTLPAGLTTPDVITPTCGGTLTVSSNVLSLAGGSLAAGGNCVISVTVTGTTAGVKNNTTTAIGSTEGGTGATSNTATVTVVAPPTIFKAFGLPIIPLNGTTSLSLTVTNPNATVALSGISFTDTLPAGLTTPDAVTPTCGGTLTISGNVLSLAGGGLAAGANCVISVTVTGATVGVKNNTTTAIGSIEGGTGATSNTATVTVVAQPTISKFFASPTVPLGGSLNMSFLLTNPGSAAVSGLAFNDTLPAGLTTPDATTSTCNGTLSIASNVLTFSGGSLAAGANCTITVSVTGATAGAQNNATGPLSSNETGAGAASNTATVTVMAPPTIAKAFGLPTIPLGATTSLSLTVTNPNATVALSGISFTDTLPSGLTTPNAITPTCGGTLTVSSNMLSFAGGSLAAGGNCVISVTVTGTAPGAQNNTTGTIGSTEGGTGVTSNTATVTVLLPPTIIKSFGASTIPLNGTTSLSLTLTNPNGANALSGLSFTDNLPAGLTAPNSSTPVCGGTLTTSGTALTLAGGSLAAGANCVISVTVTGTTAGVKNNTTGAISSTEGGTGATSNTATVTVVASPTIAKAFGAATIPVNGTTSLSLTVTNPNATATLNGITFTDTLPVGLTTPDAVTPTCGGTLTVSSNVLSLAGGSLASGANCVITLTVTGTTAGVKNNTTSAIGSTEGGTGVASNTATVTVVAPPTIAKVFGAASIPFGGTTSLNLTLNNPNATASLSGISFTDALPAGLTTPDAITPTCGGTLTISSNMLSFAGGSLAAGANCVISVTVTGTTAGVKNNTTGPIGSTESGAGAPSNTATVTVAPAGAPTIAKSFAAPTVALGGGVNMSFVLTNPGATPLTGLAFTDNLPSGLTTPNATTAICGGTLTISSNSLSLAGGSLLAGASCTITVTVTGTTAGVQNNTTGPISSNESGAGAMSNTATVTVVAPPTIAKTFGAASIPLNGTTNLDLTLTNPNATVTLSGLSFTDALPSGLTAPNATTSPCGGSLVVSGNVLTFTGGTLAGGASCTITVTVTGASTGTQNNTTSALTASGPVSVTGTSSNTATVTIAAATSLSDVPALGPWMIVLLALLLGWSGARLLRR